MKSLFTGTEIEVPEEVKKLLMPGEEVLLAFQQAGLGSLAGATGGKLTGLASVYVTNFRIMNYQPKTFGLRADIIDHLYEDMTNILLNKGFMSTDLVITMRHNSVPFYIKNIPKEGADEILKTAQMGIKRKLQGQQADSSSPVIVQQQVDITDQLMKLAQLKEKGIISEQEFEIKKKDLLAKL
jgi:hypothetical protein